MSLHTAKSPFSDAIFSADSQTDENNSNFFFKSNNETVYLDRWWSFFILLQRAVGMLIILKAGEKTWAHLNVRFEISHWFNPPFGCFSLRLINERKLHPIERK